MVKLSSTGFSFNSGAFLSLKAPQQQEPLVAAVAALAAGAAALSVASPSKGRTEPQPSKRP
jgi:hypothetical protein